MKTDRNLNLLGIAKKAGKIAIGGDAVSVASRAGTAKLILTAADASERALRRARVNAADCGALHLSVPYTQSELGDILGRGAPGSAAVLDAGLAAAFAAKLAEKEPDLYRATAEELEKRKRAAGPKPARSPAIRDRGAALAVSRERNSAGSRDGRRSGADVGPMQEKPVVRTRPAVRTERNPVVVREDDYEYDV